VSDAPDRGDVAGERREVLARLRAVIEAKDTEVSVLRAGLAAERELRRRMELRIAELERRLGMDSGNSGTPSSKEPIGARERRKAERKQRDTSERDRAASKESVNCPARSRINRNFSALSTRRIVDALAPDIDLERLEVGNSVFPSEWMVVGTASLLR